MYITYLISKWIVSIREIRVLAEIRLITKCTAVIKVIINIFIYLYIHYIGGLAQSGRQSGTVVPKELTKTSDK